MSFQDLVAAAKKHFPDLKIKYKDQSPLMKFLSKILFFNKSFMTNFTTTVGSTVYFPSESFVKIRPLSTQIVLLHELIHVNDAKKYGKLLFVLLYMAPLVFAPLTVALFFLNWLIALPLLILTLLPLPAYFRMQFEKRAYLVSLYCTYRLSVKKQFTVNLEKSAADYVSNFKDSSYYFMWPFKNVDKEFADAVVKIKSGQKPYEDPVFEMVDKLLEVC